MFIKSQLLALQLYLHIHWDRVGSMGHRVNSYRVGSRVNYFEPVPAL